jgi:hypothetical protein
MTTYQPGDRVRITNRLSSFHGHVGTVQNPAFATGAAVTLDRQIGGPLLFSGDSLEYADTTEGVGPIPTGYIEPAEQTGSDDETSALAWETRPPKPRIWADREDNTAGFRSWHLRLPNGSSYVYDTHAEAFEALSALQMGRAA